MQTGTTRASSLQNRELIAQDNVFQQEVTATPKSRSHRSEPVKDPSRLNSRLPNATSLTKPSQADKVLRMDNVTDRAVWA
jgi:hypothetical protein